MLTTGVFGSFTWMSNKMWFIGLGLSIRKLLLSFGHAKTTCNAKLHQQLQMEIQYQFWFNSFLDITRQWQREPSQEKHTITCTGTQPALVDTAIAMPTTERRRSRENTLP
jgi:hypothetical protein